MLVSLSLTLAMLAPGPLRRVQERETFARVDPYTKNDPEKVEKAGYASLGPFRFGDDHTTEEVQKALEGVPLVWVETQHFKLGSGLPEYELPGDKIEKKRIQEELERLGKRLPDVKARTRSLDPWLRMHLFAQRLEETYAEFLARFGLKESDFPTVPQDPSKSGDQSYMGQGRYLGMASKYTVLLFDRKQDLARYATVFLGGKSGDGPLQGQFAAVGSLYLATAAELMEGEYHNDSALCVSVIRGIAQNFSRGFRGTDVELPFAWTEGVGHWFSRRFDPRFHFFSGPDPARNRITDQWNWAVGVRERVERKVFPTTEAMLGWTATDELEWADHLVLWSRIDYLMTLDDGSAQKVLRQLKEPLAPGESLDAERLGNRARDAFRSGTGVELDELDARWAEWVLKTYPKP